MTTKILDWLKSHKLKFMLLMSLIVINYALIPSFGYDNPLEQAIEWVIKKWTGVDVDLTPDIISDQDFLAPLISDLF